MQRQPHEVTVIVNAAAGVEGRVGDRVLLCEERLDFHCTVEESPGMPWARAKFQVPAPATQRGM